LIQTFAVVVNDHMPRAARQRLKPFAPRIIGTRDGLDGLRAAVLLHALAEGGLSGAPGQDLARAAAPPEGGVFAKLRRLWRWLRKDERQRLLHFALSRGDGVHLAREAARLIARSARRAPDARERERHWDAAIGLLDRLCDVGAPAARRGPGRRAEQTGRAPIAAREHAPITPGRRRVRARGGQARAAPPRVRRAGTRPRRCWLSGKPMPTRALPLERNLCSDPGDAS
jgi:hypothetical protein